MTNIKVSALARPRQGPWVEQTADTPGLLLNRSNLKRTQLNESAQLVWGLCNGEHSFSDIVKLFTNAFPEQSDVADDISAMLLDLQEQKLVILDGGDSALEYQGGVVRQLEPSIELQWQLEQIRQFIFNIMRLDTAKSIDSDIEALLNAAALASAKRSDADAAPMSNSSIIPFQGAMDAPSMKAVMDKAIAELKNLLPEVAAPMELSGTAIYLKGAHMGWHSNHTRSDGRVYCSWAQDANSNFFRYEDPLSGKIITEWEQPGWNVKSFTIPPPNARFWHCIGANSLRLSIGFRYNLPES